MKPARPIVTDHAVLRYLERAHGVDVAAIRAHIAGLVATGVERGALAVKAENVRFLLIDGRVITVLHRRHLPFPPREHWGRRSLR